MIVEQALCQKREIITILTFKDKKTPVFKGTFLKNIHQAEEFFSVHSITTAPGKFDVEMLMKFNKSTILLIVLVGQKIKSISVWN